MKGFSFASFAAISSLLPSVAAAQIPGDGAIVTYSSMASRLCLSMADKSIVAGKGFSDEPLARLAEAIITDVGLLPSDLLTAPHPGQGENLAPPDRGVQYEKRLVDRMRLVASGALLLPGDPDHKLRQAIRIFESGLTPEQKLLNVEGSYQADPARSIFAEPNPQWTFKCRKDEQTKTILENYATLSKAPVFAARKKPEELSLSGEKAKEAGAISVGLVKEWKKADDGTDKISTTFTFDGTVGYRLAGSEHARFSSYLFAQYNVSRVRKNPAPPLDSGATIKDDDTDALNIGVTANWLGNADDNIPIWVTAESGFVMNFVDGSRRLRTRFALEPGLNFDAGICRFGSAKLWDKEKWGARCLARFDTDVGLWLKDGRFTDKAYADYWAAGGNLSYELFYRTGKNSKVIASAQYRYLPVLSGELDDIERIDISLNHRNFFDFGGAIDYGFSYTNGVNALSLEKEKKLTFGLGFIY